VSTQAVVSCLKGTQGDYTSGAVYLRLASQYRNAATETHQLLAARKASLILSQTSFRWGLIWLPVFFGLCFALVPHLRNTPPAWANALKDSVADTQKSLETRQQQEHEDIERTEKQTAAFGVQLSTIQASATNEAKRQQQLDDDRRVLLTELSKRLDKASDDMTRLAQQVNGVTTTVAGFQHDSAQLIALQREAGVLTARLHEVESQVRLLQTIPDSNNPNKRSSTK
jgi:hypothetical protein